ncbi:MAG TPA: Do family serine endopeptidase [Gallionella sp.]|nr:Do family serine endopeptidase [Gallionella sp.]
MKIAKNAQAIGIVLGLAIFVAAGLFITVAANKPEPTGSLPAGAIPESVTAPAEQVGKAFAAVAAHAKPSVVSVYSEKTVQMQSPDFEFPFGNDFFDQFFGHQFGEQFHFHGQQGHPKEFKVPQHGMGTGMLLDRQGHVLTNYHVVQEVDQIKVQLSDKRTYKAKIVGSDRKTDVAILELQGSYPGDLPPVELGDSDALEDGNLVMAIGAPFGLIQTVTTGVISAKGRSDVGIADYEDFLQTDAPINPGNSGGPLINMRGEVIGMNSAIETKVGEFSGVGFAIPVNMIKSMLPTLIKGGQITRGMIGVTIQAVTRELADQFHLSDTKGALISQVNKGSPADQAGLKSGDVIVRFNGKAVHDTGQLRNFVASSAPGTTATIVAIRNGKEETFTVTIGKMAAETMAAGKAAPGGGNRLAQLGLAVQTLTPDLASQYGVGEKRGVLITDVEDGSLAAISGLQPGDVIVEADRKPVSSLAELQAALAKDKEQTLLLIKRKGGSIFVVFRLR